MPARKRVAAGALPAEALGHDFPRLTLPLQPPFPPEEAKAVKQIPPPPGWLYEPKWDGFRCLVFRDSHEVVLQSKAGQPLHRYFPELVEALRALPAKQFVLDGEIVIRRGRVPDFDALLQRIHPAASRIRRLAHETPATLMAFDLLVSARGALLTGRPLSARRMALQEFAAVFKKSGKLELSPASADFAQAEKWMREGAALGMDGVVAKRLDREYASGERTAMVKIKRLRTADCVVGGFRWSHKPQAPQSRAGAFRRSRSSSQPQAARREIGSLLLGLFNHEGRLDHVGFCSSFTREERAKLLPIIQPLITPAVGSRAGFTGKAPGGPSRWTRDERSTEWVPLRHELVGEFQYDHFSGGRFRHGAKFLRWRPEKSPRQCTTEQLASASH